MSLAVDACCRAIFRASAGLILRAGFFAGFFAGFLVFVVFVVFVVFFFVLIVVLPSVRTLALVLCP